MLNATSHSPRVPDQSRTCTQPDTAARAHTPRARTGLLARGPPRSLPLPFPSILRRVRSLHYNNLGPEGGMALAEALKSNTTLKTLESAALPSNPPMP